MTRILLIIAAIVAASVLLWSSWRLNRRLFALVATCLGVGLAIWVVAILNNQQSDWVSLATETVSLSLNERHATESGVRITGSLTNNGDTAVAMVLGHVRVLDCQPDTDNCREVTSAPLELRMHVPAGTRYPFTTMVRLEQPGEYADERWLLEVDGVRGYAGS
jgi:hypothetical protein